MHGWKDGYMDGWMGGEIDRYLLFYAQSITNGHNNIKQTNKPKKTKRNKS